MWDGGDNNSNNDDTGTIMALIATAVTLGVFHVLSGPDHLSALATLSASIGNCKKAFVLGVLWGCGHSTGLVVVATVFIALGSSSSRQQQKQQQDQDQDRDSSIHVPDRTTTIFETMVGVFMLLLGAFGILRARWKHDAKLQRQHLEHHHYLPCTDHCPKEQQQSNRGDDTTDDDDDDDDNELVASGMIGKQQNGQEEETSKYQPLDTEKDNNNNNNNNRQVSCFRRCAQSVSKTMLSFFIGIIHGLAGPGGILGVIPAIRLRDWKLTTVYLGSFCLSSTLTMGCFAAIYGTCCALLAVVGQRGGRTTITKREYEIEMFSASLSCLVGVLWLVLLSLGILEDLFP